MNSFKPDLMVEHPTILLLGKRRVGKSYLSRDLVYNEFYKNRKYKFFILISPTCFLNDDYNFIPDEWKFERFSTLLLQKLFKRQDDLKKKYKNKGDFNTLLILDDVVGLSNQEQSKLLATILLSGRHRRISIILSLQYLFTKEMSKSCRDCLDYGFIFPQSNTENIKAVVSQWLGGSKEKEKEGWEIVKTVPKIENHQILVIDNTKISDKNDNLYSYIAQEIPKKAKIKKV
jgi:hypothetical protein